MRDYMQFCRKYWFWLLLVVLAFAAAGSVKGASVESVLWEERLTQISETDVPGETIPYMSEIFGLAGEQSLWLSFRYAAAGGLAGAAAAVLIAALVYRLRGTAWFRALDHLLYKKE